MLNLLHFFSPLTYFDPVKITIVYASVQITTYIQSNVSEIICFREWGKEENTLFGSSRQFMNVYIRPWRPWLLSRSISHSLSHFLRRARSKHAVWPRYSHVKAIISDIAIRKTQRKEQSMHSKQRDSAFRDAHSELIFIWVSIMSELFVFFCYVWCFTSLLIHLSFTFVTICLFSSSRCCSHRGPSQRRIFCPAAICSILYPHSFIITYTLLMSYILHEYFPIFLYYLYII